MIIRRFAYAHVNDAGELILPCAIDELGEASVLRCYHELKALPTMTEETKADFEAITRRADDIIEGNLTRNQRERAWEDLWGNPESWGGRAGGQGFMEGDQ